MNDVIKHKIKHNAHRALVSVKWVIFAILVGGIVGLCGTAFYFCLTIYPTASAMAKLAVSAYISALQIF